MGLDVTGLLDAVQSDIMALGLFERVNTHEPKNAPGHGLTCAIWAQSINTFRQRSGLDTTSAQVTFNVRIYSTMIQEPQDAIDPEVMRAVDVILNAFNGDFTLGGQPGYVDLMSITSTAGYITIDKTAYRVMTITLPVIVDDVWNQEA